jgi:hypothetical protein
MNGIQRAGGKKASKTYSNPTSVPDTLSWVFVQRSDFVHFKTQNEYNDKGEKRCIHLLWLMITREAINYATEWRKPL